MQKLFVLRPGVWLSILTICLLDAFAGPARAQTPTPEQIEIFQNLPPDQQQAIIEAMGRGGTGMGTAGSSSRTRTDRRDHRA